MMHLLHHLSLLVLLLLVVAPSPIRCDKAHDVLAAYGLPRGLLPDGVKSYYISDDDGSGNERSFELQLSSPSCYVRFPSNLVYYDSTIKGKISYGRISDLSGIQAKKLFLWFSVTGILAHPDKDAIDFQVGIISQTLPESDFQSVPICKASVASPICSPWCRPMCFPWCAALLSASS